MDDMRFADIMQRERERLSHDRDETLNQQTELENQQRGLKNKLTEINREDFAVLGIDAEMQLTPGSAARRAVLLNQPFTGSTELQAGAVHQQTQRAGTRPAERWHFQHLAAAHC